MNPVLIFIPVAVAIVLFFMFRPSKKKEDLKPNVVPQPNEPVLEITSSFVDSSFVQETEEPFQGFKSEEVLEVSTNSDVLFEKLPEAAPVEAPMEVQAEAPKPKAKPKPKKTAAKKKAVTKK